jgi:hypothetical protein
MRTREELQTLRDELGKMTGFIADYATKEEYHEEAFRPIFAFACNASDTIDWVLGEIETDWFMSDAYLDRDKLKGMVRTIEKRTGKKLEEYE